MHSGINGIIHIYMTTSLHYQVDETATVGTLVATMAATDLDTGSDGDITYSISGRLVMLELTSEQSSY